MSDRQTLIEIDGETLALGIQEHGVAKLKDGNPLIPEENIWLAPDSENPLRQLASRAQIAARIYDAYNLKKQLEGYLEIIGSNLDAMSKRLGEIQSLEGMEKFSQAMRDGVTVNFTLKVEDYVSIDGEKRDLAYAWLLAKGLGGIIKPTVHHATLNAQIRAFLRGAAEDEEENVPETDMELETPENLIVRNNIQYWLNLATQAEEVGAGIDLPESIKCYSVVKSAMTKTRTKK